MESIVSVTSVRAVMPSNVGFALIFNRTAGMA